MTPDEKIKTFEKHWVAAFGKIWNDYGEEDLYHQFAGKSDIRVLVDAIWKIRESKEKGNLGDLRNIYKGMMRKRRLDAIVIAARGEPDDCDVCDNRGMAWCIYLEEADLCPCDCHWGSKQNDKHFGEDMPFTMVAVRLAEMHRLGTFKTKGEAEVFLKAHLDRIDKEHEAEQQKQG